jgi:hypothetical protein
MKTIRITGGIGNQLFQYAFGLYLSKKTGDKVYYDPQTKSHSSEWVSRKFGLTELLGNNLDIQSSYLLHPTLYRIKRKIAQSFPKLFDRFVVEVKQHVSINMHTIQEGQYFDGYWQCLSYVEEVKDIVFANIDSFRNAIIKTAIGTEIYQNPDNVISLHVRHGDYLNNPENFKTYGICPKSYYIKAIETLKSKLNQDHARIYIFTDDEKWCQANFSEFDCNIISGNTAETDLILMSLCKHNIIANSTFSWWGAYLNRNPEKIIIAPKQWYTNSEASVLNNFLPPHYRYI